MKRKTLCNPVRISYAYQAGYHARESADPAVILFRDEYYLFASHGHGYWVSSDLADWEYLPVDTDRFPQFRLFAPGVCVVGDTMYLTHSERGSVLRSDHPRDPASWVDIGTPFGWNDPAFYTGDDGFIYVYEGCSDTEPIRVAKLDPDRDMQIAEGPYPCVCSDKAHRGFERSGENNEDDRRLPYFEGPWMNRIGERYYLTYAAPGTEFPVYADGCFVGDSPMGPFSYCENSPVCFKNTGFLRGAGHGCLFADKAGRLWKMDTVAIGVNHLFERRLALFPAKIGNDGRLYTNTEHGDLPMYLPEENEDPFGCPGPDWYVLSENAGVCASSFLEGHEPTLAVTEDARTWWSAATGAPGEWIRIDLGRTVSADAVQIMLADQDADDCSGRDHGFGYHYTVEVSADGAAYAPIDEVRNREPDDYSFAYYAFEDRKSFRYLRLTNRGTVPAGGRFAVSGIRVFGNEGDKPSFAPQNLRAERMADSRDLLLRWDPVPGAVGYLVRFGIDPCERHTHMRIRGACSCEIRCLNADIPYYVSVDAYSYGGTTATGCIVKA